MKGNPNILFSTQNYTYLKDKIIALGNIENGEVEVKNFPDGERYQRIASEVTNKNVFLIAGTISDADTLEAYDLACGLEKYGAISLTLIIPYYGYSTMERAVKPGEIVTAKTRALLLSSIPRTYQGNTIVLMDLHSEGLPYYFEKEVRTVHLYCKEIILEAAQELGGKDFVLACTDAGRAKWVESLANDLGVQAAFVFKRRISGNETTLTSISADVKGKKVVIYDDMIRTGGSLIQAAQAYLQAGATEISAITTHGLFNTAALKKMQESGIFKKVISTDTHPNVIPLTSDFLEIKTVASLIHKFIQK